MDVGKLNPGNVVLALVVAAETVDDGVAKLNPEVVVVAKDEPVPVVANGVRVGRLAAVTGAAAVVATGPKEKLGAAAVVVDGAVLVKLKAGAG